MEINHTVHSAVRYIRNHLVRFLLLAVILTTGLTLRMAAFAKYSSYLNDYTSAVAGDFFFTSDYLFAPEDRSGVADYHINSWKGDAYEIGIEIRNYENSLRFNHSGTDFYYWVEAGVYTDEACTNPDDRFQTASVTYESIGATDSSGKKYGFMPGMEVFDHTEGMQEVKVKITPLTTISPGPSGHCYMKVTAHTVPLTDVKKLNFENGTSRGVYSATQEAVFFLNITSNTASIDYNLYAGSTTDYTVRYRVLCNSSEGTGGSVRAKVYYNSDRLTPDIALGNNYAEGASYEGPYKAADGWRYVQASINVGGSEDLYFYKTSLAYTIVDSDFAAVVLNTEDIDTTEYDIVPAAATGGSVSSLQTTAGTEITKASMGTRVFAVLAPDEGYMVHTFSVDSLSNPITVTASGENRYFFEMTNSAVTVTPTFVRKVMVAASENGSVTATPLGAPTGTTVYLTVTPDEGYELEAIALNGSNASLTQLTDTLYSFEMPDAAANVTATFAEITEETGESGS